MNRQNKARWLLPAVAFTNEEDLLRNDTDDHVADDLLFDAGIIAEALKGRGYDTTVIETPYEPKLASKRRHFNVHTTSYQCYKTLYIR